MNFLSVLYARAGITVDGVTTLNNTATGLTPATNDNSTKLATTGYVKNQNYYPYPTGTTSQYVRGDGSLATFTQTGGGGSSVSYYLNGSVSQGTIGGNTYYEMSKTAIVGINTDFSINANGYVAQFVTDAGDPALLNIPGGNWNFEMWFSASSGGGSPKFYVELYKYDGTTLTLIASGSAVPESITGGTATDLYVTALAVPTTTLTLTDRLAIRVYVLNSGRTITLHTQNGHLCQVITTFTTGLTALNGLTAQVQNFAVGAGGSDFNISSVVDTHTFNLPTASATKRGALSSIDWSAFDAKVDFGDLSATAPLNYNGSGLFTIAQSSGSTNGYLSSTDWTTFNAKIGGSGTANYVAKFTSGSVVGNSSIYDNGTNVGIGTTSPTAKLTVSDTSAVTNQIDLIGYALNIKGHIGEFYGNLYLSSNYFYNGTQNADDSFYGQAAIVLSTGATNTSYIDFNLSDAGATNPSSKVRITATGNVLINTTTNAGYKLDVNGTARVSGAATFSDFVSVPSATANGFYKLLSTSASASSREYRIYSDGYNYGDLVIDKATTQGGSTYSLQFILNSGNLTLGSIPNIGSGSLFAGAASFNGAVNATSFTASNRTILTAGGVYDNATNGNNIGIGFGAGVIISTNGSGTYSAQNIGNATYPWYSANFVSTITASQGLFTSGSSLAGVIVKGSSSNQGVLQFGDANTNFQIQGGVDYSGMLFKVGSVERMRIVLSSGNVLINTTTDAGYKLYVNGDAYLGAAYFSGTYSTFNSSYFTVNSSESVIGNNTSDIVGIAGNTMYFPGNGNVGIGTTSPSAKFEIDKTANNTISQTNANFFFGSKTLDIGLLGQQLLSAPYSYVLQAGVQAMTVFTPISLNPLGGNVLIGTTTDAGYKLDVNGSARFSGKLTISNTSDVYAEMTTSSVDGDSFLGFSNTGDGNSSWGIGRRNTGEFWIANYTGNFLSGTRTTPLVIASTGAATFASSVTATNFIVPGGTSAQFLKADGSLDSNVYLTATSSTFSYTSSVTLSPTFQNTGVSSANLGTGAYLVTCNADDFGVGGGQYNCTYTGLMYFFAGGTNGVDANEIVLHHTGHADQGRYIYLRTLNTASADGKTYLQISGNGTNSGASNYQFTFKKLL
jgi:hypothetical protein